MSAGGALVLRQPAVPDAVAVRDALTEAFEAARAAVLGGRAVVLVLDDRDLLGQGRVEDAALASALLGLMRSLALEGARAGWTINVVTVRDDESGVDAACAWLGRADAPSGQLMRLGTAHLGKAWP